MRLFLCGDVMTGRGIDQILRYPTDPRIYEPYVKDARDYLTMSEMASGSFKKPVAFNYIWGDAMETWGLYRPDLKVVNLETAVTHSNDAWPGKGINYRMSPENIPSLQVAGIDFCSLANNHTLDWGYKGLFETVEVLRKAGIKTAGAGVDLAEATSPSVVNFGENGRVVLIAMGMESSGIPPEWAATDTKPGLFLIDNSIKPGSTFENIISQYQAGDIVIVSIHWGDNWVYKIPQAHIDIAHMLIDQYDVAIVHGHSSHHPLGVEVYKGHLILYGCGDFITDYEGITGYESFRGDLAIMYFAELDKKGNLLTLHMHPMQVRNFRLNYVSNQDLLWLENSLNTKGKRFKTSVKRYETGFTLQW